MKMRIFAFALSVMCFAVSTSGLAFAEDSAEVRALNDLLGYVYKNEIIHSDIQWILKAFKRFDSERSWETLQLARAALSIAKKDIEGLTPPETEMTSADRTELIKRGIDLSFLSGTITSFRAEQISALNTCSNLNSGIYQSVFLNEDWKNCMRNVRVLDKIADCYIQYLANTVDWTLASINDESVSKKFNSILEKHCPLTRSRQSKKKLHKEEIESETQELLNHIGELVAEMTLILGAEYDRLNVIKDALAENDLSLFAKDITAISGMPSAVPSPEWFKSKDVYYYWQESGDIVAPPQPGKTLERVPDYFRIIISGVALDDVKTYQQYLKKIGVATINTSTENEIACQYGDSIFCITWSDGTVVILSIEKPVCFVPGWYLPAINSLSQQRKTE